MMIRHYAMPVLVVLLAAADAMAEIKLPPLFAGDMVIQRDTQAPVWGWATPGEQVAVNASWGMSAAAPAGSDGRWEVRLQTPEAGGPHTIEIMGTSTVKLENIMSGDVWICSGQSNMEWPLVRTTGSDEEIAAADYPGLRHFKMNRAHAAEPAEEYMGRWQVCSPESAGGFSAVGYYFGKYIHQQQGVPIGLIGANWGGTRIEPWTPPVGFRMAGDPLLDDVIREMERMDPTTDLGHEVYSAYVSKLKEWIPAAEQSLAERLDLPPHPETPAWTFGGNQQDSSFIYNGMIAPVLPYAIKGVIWYQGESNGGESRELYRAKMKALIQGWRAVWGQGDFPFYFVQLANLNQSNPNNPEGGDGYARVRQAQLDSLAITNTGMAVIIDVGEAGDIHPRNKRDVGKRLARWALARDYGMDVVPSGPLFRDMTVTGGEAVLTFDYADRGLVFGLKEGMEPVTEVPDASLKWVSIRGGDGTWHWADAVIHGDTLVVSSPDVPEPVAVRYGYTSNPEGAKLYNREGLPASPFTTEN